MRRKNVEESGVGVQRSRGNAPRERGECTITIETVTLGRIEAIAADDAVPVEVRRIPRVDAAIEEWIPVFKQKVGYMRRGVVDRIVGCTEGILDSMTGRGQALSDSSLVLSRARRQR